MPTSALIRVRAGGVLKSLNLVEGALVNPRPYLHLIAEELFRVSRKSFEDEQSPIKPFSKWPRLSPKYQIWKMKQGKGAQGILRFRGQLLRSVFRGVHGRIAFVSTGNLDHARVHQQGFRGSVQIPAHIRKAHRVKNFFGRGKTVMVSSHKVNAFRRKLNIPARPYMGFPESSENRVIRDIERDIQKKGNQ